VQRLFWRAAEVRALQGRPIRETIVALGGKSLFLPDLADRVTDELYGKRTTLAEASALFKLGDRVELQRWRSTVAAMFAEIGL
jgi:hypothetical protein